jgi:DMSO/TMAO reductase YedYZ molybdopterin-dependent catalytic subunit
MAARPTRPTAPEPIVPSMHRRTFLRAASAGTLVVALGGATYVCASEDEEGKARAMKRPDGRARLPPNQYLLKHLRPMGGAAGDPAPGHWKLRVHGEVEAPYELDFAGLLAMPQVERTCDVHCVTKWTMLDARFTGVRIADVAARARPKPTARHVIFEAPGGYTANVLLREALAPNALVAHRHEGGALAIANGAPVRALVPDLYFWKSAKWLTGIRFVTADEPGYWEQRGYNNHADPWREERYS